MAGELNGAAKQAAKLFSIIPVPCSVAPLTTELFVQTVHFLSGLPWSLPSYKNVLTCPESPAGLELTPTCLQSHLSFSRTESLFVRSIQEVMIILSVQLCKPVYKQDRLPQDQDRGFHAQKAPSAVSKQYHHQLYPPPHYIIGNTFLPFFNFGSMDSHSRFSFVPG